MTGDNITRLPPPTRADKNSAIRVQIRSLMPSAFLHVAVTTLAKMRDRWACQVFAEKDRKELEEVLDHLATAEQDLNSALANGAAAGDAS